MFIGANIAFFPMHFLEFSRHAAPHCRLPGGLRRLELHCLNRLCAISFAGLLVFLFGMTYAFSRKVYAPANPWGAGAIYARMDVALATVLPQL